MTETKKKNIWYIVALSICSLGIVALICLFIWAFPYKSKDNESKENDTGLRVMKEERTHLYYDEEADYSNLDWYYDDTYFYFKNVDCLYNLSVALRDSYSSGDSISLYSNALLTYSNSNGASTNITCQFNSIAYVGIYNIIRIRQYTSTSTSGFALTIQFETNNHSINNISGRISGTNMSTNYALFTLYRVSKSSLNVNCQNYLYTLFEDYVDSLETTFSYLASSGEDSSTQTIDTGNKIVIAQDFNPNVWLSSTLYNNGSLASAGGNSIIIDLTGLKFQCNDMTFDTIRIYRNKVDSIYISFDGVSIANESNIAPFKDLYFVYGFSYYDSVNDVLLPVWKLDNSIINGNNVILVTRSIWINDSYRTLVILEDSETIQSVPAYSNMTTRQLLSVVASVNSNLLQQDGIYLIKQSINGISGLLNLTILPGITIGLLMFIPLIVSVILFIVKLVKK